MTCRLFFLILSLLTFTAHAELPLDLRFPTENDFLIKKQPEKFYMYVNRNFEGVESKPWQAGSYGFVRTSRRTKEGVIQTKFHEGLDIKPLKRDKRNKPLDLVNAIAPGTIVYVNAKAAASNYGKYVVVQHDWGNGPFFSLYAHLADIVVQTEQRVLGGTALGQLGYTGVGLNRTRAHVHLELNVLLSDSFDSWFLRELGGRNDKGLYNGLNLAGLDLGRLYLSLQNNPSLTLPEFIRKKPVYFKITLPRKAGEVPFLLKTYPWLSPTDIRKRSASWEISFTNSGFPTHFIPSNRRVTKPTVTYVKSTQTKQSYKSKKLLKGTGSSAELSASGLRYMRLLVPSAFPELEEVPSPATSEDNVTE